MGDICQKWRQTEITKFCLFSLDNDFLSDVAVKKQNKQLTFLQNGQYDLENIMTVLSLIFCSIRSFMGAILLGTSGEGVRALFRLETTKPMVENNKLLEIITFTPCHRGGCRVKTWQRSHLPKHAKLHSRLQTFIHSVLDIGHVLSANFSSRLAEGQ